MLVKFTPDVIKLFYTCTRSKGTSVAAEPRHFSFLSAALNPISDKSRHSKRLCHFKLWPSSSTILSHSLSHFLSILTSLSTKSIDTHLSEQRGKLQSGHRTLPSTGFRHSTQTTFCCLKKLKTFLNIIFNWLTEIENFIFTKTKQLCLMEGIKPI
jgi:hypothetical protein